MKFIYTLLFIFVFFALSVNTYAHGGFEKSSENTTISINQNPVSPLVGEKVTFSFNFKDLSVQSSDISEQNLKNILVKLLVKDTFYGDESRDNTIFQKSYKTDTNGDLAFEYTFNKENYFDIEFSYKDKKGTEHEVGFLVQPRKAETNSQFIILYILTAGIIGFLLGVVINKSGAKKSI